MSLSLPGSDSVNSLIVPHSISSGAWYGFFELTLLSSAATRVLGDSLERCFETIMSLLLLFGFRLREDRLTVLRNQSSIPKGGFCPAKPGEGGSVARKKGVLSPGGISPSFCAAFQSLEQSLSVVPDLQVLWSDRVFELYYSGNLVEVIVAQMNGSLQGVFPEM